MTVSEIARGREVIYEKFQAEGDVFKQEAAKFLKKFQRVDQTIRQQLEHQGNDLTTRRKYCKFYHNLTDNPQEPIGIERYDEIVRDYVTCHAFDNGSGLCTFQFSEFEKEKATTAFLKNKYARGYSVGNPKIIKFLNKIISGTLKSLPQKQKAIQAKEAAALAKKTPQIKQIEERYNKMRNSAIVLLGKDLPTEEPLPADFPKEQVARIIVDLLEDTDFPLFGTYQEAILCIDALIKAGKSGGSKGSVGPGEFLGGRQVHTKPGDTEKEEPATITDVLEGIKKELERASNKQPLSLNIPCYQIRNLPREVTLNRPLFRFIKYLVVARQIKNDGWGIKAPKELPKLMADLKALDPKNPLLDQIAQEPIWQPILNPSKSVSLPVAPKAEPASPAPAKQALSPAVPKQEPAAILPGPTAPDPSKPIASVPAQSTQPGNPAQSVPPQVPPIAPPQPAPQLPSVPLAPQQPVSVSAQPTPLQGRVRATCCSRFTNWLRSCFKAIRVGLQTLIKC